MSYIPASPSDVILHFHWKQGHQRIAKVLQRLQTCLHVYLLLNSLALANSSFCQTGQLHTPVRGLRPSLCCCKGPPFVLTCLRFLCSSLLFSKRPVLLLSLLGNDTGMLPRMKEYIALYLRCNSHGLTEFVFRGKSQGKSRLRTSGTPRAANRTLA